MGWKREQFIKQRFQEIDERSPGKREQLIKLFQDIAKGSPDAKLTPGPKGTRILKRSVHLKIREMLTGGGNTMANVAVWQAGVKIATDFASDFQKRNGGKKHHPLHQLIVHFENKMRHTLALSPRKRQEYPRQPRKMWKPVDNQQLRAEIGQCITCGLAKR